MVILKRCRKSVFVKTGETADALTSNGCCCELLVCFLNELFLWKVEHTENIFFLTFCLLAFCLVISPRSFYCTKMCEKSKSTTFSYYEKLNKRENIFFTICLLTFCLVSRNEVAGRAEQTKNVFVQISQVSSSILLIYPTLKNPPYYSSYTENFSILLIYPTLKNPPYYLSYTEKSSILHCKLGGIQIVLASSAIGFLANFGNSIYWEAFAKLGLWKMILIPVFEGRSNPCRETISISLPKSESDRMGLTTFSQLETTGFPIWVNDKKSFSNISVLKNLVLKTISHSSFCCFLCWKKSTKNVGLKLDLLPAPHFATKKHGIYWGGKIKCIVDRTKIGGWIECKDVIYVVISSNKIYC